MRLVLRLFGLPVLTLEADLPTPTEDDIEEPEPAAALGSDSTVAGPGIPQFGFSPWSSKDEDWTE